MLAGKNRCIRRLLDFSTAFRSELDSGSIDRLPLYENQRDAAIRAMALYDKQIETTVKSIASSERTPELIEKVRKSEAERIQYIEEILKLDDAILAHLASIKDKITNDLKSGNKVSHNLKKFKSAWVSKPGEGLDRKL